MNLNARYDIYKYYYLIFKYMSHKYSILFKRNLVKWHCVEFMEILIYKRKQNCYNIDRGALRDWEF